MKKLYSLATLFVVCIFSCCTLVSYAQSPQCTDFTYQGVNYSVGRMGGHCWMKTNLRATRYSDSVVVPFARPYLGNPGDAATYGLLYNWASASRQTTLAANMVRVQGVCPTGWVLPVAADYAMLNNSIGTEGLVSSDGWLEGYGTSTASGFNALPAGYCTDAGRYVDRGLKAYFWTSDATVATATACGFSFDCPTMLTEEKARNYGFSVRCILDERFDATDTITFISNGGANTMPKQVVPRGTATALNTNTFTHDGNWEFLGWSTDGLHTVEYANQANITTNGNDTLYAVWHTWCTGTKRGNEMGTSRIDSVKDHQNNWYKVVEIGTGSNAQCWLKENMRATTEPDSSTSIVQATASETSYSVPLAYRYNNSTDYSDKYGLLYNFPAAMNINDQSTSFTYPHRGICPEGWHVPQDSEWSTLATEAGCTAEYGSGTGLGKLTGGCDWTTNGSGSQPGNYSYTERNSSGFSALPAGVYFGSYVNAGNRSSFWCSTPDDSNGAVFRYFDYNDEYVYRSYSNRSYGFSVRCVRNPQDTITFIANGGANTMPKQVVSRGTATALNTNTFTHDGNWEFLGWSTDGLHTVEYANQANITTNGNDTLYAVWHTYCTGTPLNNEMGTSRIDSVKDHQNNWYKVVEIGTGANAQCWLKENMRATSEPTAPSISILQNPANGSANSEPRAYYYGDNAANGAKYGCLYNFPAAMNINDQRESFTYPHRGICPEGWHIPQDSEWSTLATAAGCSAAYGSGTGLGKLTGGCDWSTFGSGEQTYPGNYSYSERNSSGFSALPAGLYDGSFYNAGGNASFWSSTPNGSFSAYRRYFYYYGEYVSRNDYGRYYGFSVRCVRDNAGITLGAVSKTDSTATTLSISAAYTATQTVTGATVCAYTDAACTNPAGSCAADVTYETSPITGTVTGLTPNTQYYIKVTATTAGGTESAVTGPFGTKEVTMSIASDPASATVKLCGNTSVQVTYIATVSGETPTSYSWSVSGGTATSSTTDTLVVTAGAGTINVTCTAAGVSATASTTVTSGDTAATLGLCEDCNAGSITMKSGNCTSLTWVNDADPSITGTVSSVTTGSVVLTVSSSAPAGVYTFTGTNSDGCSVSRSATLGNGTAHPCSVTRALNQTDAATHKNYEWGTTSKLDSVSDHEGNVYRVVQIGEGANAQCWLAENMRCTTSPKGNLTAGGSTTSYYKAYYYNYSSATQFSLRERGYLYNWAGAIDTNGTSNITASFTGRRGICPEGWHIPTDEEWKTLEGGYLTETDGTTAITSSTLNSTGYRGKGAGKFTGGCDWSTSGSGEQTYPGNYSYSDRNTTGFSALPAGYCDGSGFNSAGDRAFFWSATSGSGHVAYYRSLGYSSAGVSRYSFNKDFGRSVRCLRD